MKETASDLYTVLYVALDGAQEERKDIVSDYMKILLMFKKQFKNNRNLSASLAYLNKAFQEYFEEAEFENQVYNKIIDYFESFEFLTDCTDEEILADISDIVDYFEELFETRFFSLARMVDYYKELLENNILTNMNYVCRHLEKRVSEEMQERILNLIPQAK